MAFRSLVCHSLRIPWANDVTVTVRAASPTASCPCCGTIYKRVQSRYTSTLRDLPASGRPVELIVCVRRFFCQQSACVRKIFAERFPSLTLPRVKFTLRLQETLREMGFALGGEAGARLGRHLSIPGSPETILRLVKQPQLPAACSPRVVGIDDWSWKRRLRYGTFQERGQHGKSPKSLYTRIQRRSGAACPNQWKADHAGGRRARNF